MADNTNDDDHNDILSNEQDVDDQGKSNQLTNAEKKIRKELEKVIQDNPIMMSNSTMTEFVSSMFTSTQFREALDAQFSKMTQNI